MVLFVIQIVFMLFQCILFKVLKKYKIVSQLVLKITYFIEVLTFFNILLLKKFCTIKKGIQYKVLKRHNGRKYNDFRH
jgi:hypothetical protein